MTLNFDTTRAYLNEFKFRELFVEILGWSSPRGLQGGDLTVEDSRVSITPIAQLAGVGVFELRAENGQLPGAKLRASIHKEISKLHHENLLIFLDGARTQSLWYWAKREGSRLIPREHLFVRGQPGDLFLGKLNAMVVDISELDEAGDINVLEVARRLQKALDIQRVTKQFYTEFADLRLTFIDLIEGIDDERERRWYASVLLNRLMFIYFLQRKGFLDGGRLDYLYAKLAESRARGADRYYHEFLRALFFEGFAKPEERRSDAARAMLGKIRYLNGGLFLPHAVELKYDPTLIPLRGTFPNPSPEGGRENPHLPMGEGPGVRAGIFIPDAAFENLLGLFGRYSWNLDDTPGGQDNEINPDVLGYIFEKYINQKAFGAYYTRPEITEYLCEQTIYRLILQKVNTPGVPGVVAARQFERIEDLLTSLDAPLCRQLLFDVLPKLSILDPAAGSGAFLVAAMKTLINAYSAIIGRIEFLGDRGLAEWLEKTKRAHPSLAYYIKRSIITDNLFGVDIMEEATEIARLRLFLALVASARTVDELEPLPNIDFNILPGNSLIGLLRVDEAAFNQKMAGGAQLSLFQQKTYRQIVNEKRAALDSYRHASAFTEDLGALREAIQARRREDYGLLNEMLLDEFRELGIKYEQATWDEKKRAIGKPLKRAVQLPDIEALAPFHWGYEFDEVMNERGGFDVIITNPPWDIFKPNAKEFFAEHSDLVSKKRMDIKDFEKEQSKLLENADVRAAWLDYLSQFAHVSAYYRSATQFANQISIVNGKKAGSDTNLYKLFVEQCFNLLANQSMAGIIIPSGIYTDLGTKQLREMLFSGTRVNAILGLSNEKFLFEGVHHGFKFALLTFQKGGHTETFSAAFRINPREAVSPENLDSFLHDAPAHVQISTNLIQKLSPDSLSVMEFRSQLDAHIAEKMFAFPMLGENLPEKWNLSLTNEFHMTADSHLFITEPGKGKMPLYEGKMINQFDHLFALPRYWISEKSGRKAILGKRQDDGERLAYQEYRLVHRSVGSSTNERTMITTIIPSNVFYAHSLNGAKNNWTYGEMLFALALLNSLVVDYSLRQRVSQNLTMFYVYQLPVPRLTAGDPAFAPIVERAAKLICTTPEFQGMKDELGRLKNPDGSPLFHPSSLISHPSERAQLRAELDAMVAHLYGLTESEFAHILSTFPLVAEDVKAGVMREFGKMGITQR